MNFKYIWVILLFLLVLQYSCKDKEICVSCIEVNSQFRPDDFCGTPDEVDAYINTLNNTGGPIGQQWECEKY